MEPVHGVARFVPALSSPVDGWWARTMSGCEVPFRVLPRPTFDLVSEKYHACTYRECQTAPAVSDNAHVDDGFKTGRKADGNVIKVPPKRGEVAARARRRSGGERRGQKRAASGDGRSGFSPQRRPAFWSGVDTPASSEPTPAQRPRPPGGEESHMTGNSGRDPVTSLSPCF